MSRKFLLCLLLVLAWGNCSHAADSLPWLRTNGTHIVDEHGKRVVLSGVNLGSWLVEEMWMMPYQTQPPEGSTLTEVKDHVSLWRNVEQRFGKAEMIRIRTAMRQAWITPSDFDRIRAAGMNCVRLPFTYDLLEEPDGFAWIDKALTWARERKLYVVLDLHGAPGRQSSADHTGQSGVNRLFRDLEMVKQTEAVWTKIAQRYRNHPEVAGYNLLNEPMGAPDPVTLHLVHDRLLRAVRAVDPRHIIIIEDGYKGPDSFPYLNLVGWTNVMLSWHHYNFNAKSANEQEQGLLRVASAAGRTQRNRPAPVYLGEFQIEPHGTPANLEAGLKALQQGGHSWAAWNYKVVMKDGSGGMWGWYRSTKPADLLDIFRDSADVLIEKSRQLRTENLQENSGMTAAFKASTQVQPLPPLQEIVPTVLTAPATWRYTLARPSPDWFNRDYNAADWKEGLAGFGGQWPFSGKVNTEWKTSDIWLRREFTLPSNVSHLRLLVCQDDDAEIYINGVLAASLSGYRHTYEEVPILPEALATLHTGKNVMAIHCRQGAGDQYIDAGIIGLAG